MFLIGFLATIFETHFIEQARKLTGEKDPELGKVKIPPKIVAIFRYYFLSIFLLFSSLY
jgi:hypothetical protein